MIALYIFLGIIGAALVLYVFPNLLIASVVYRILLVRTSKKKWSRNCSWDDEEQKKMFALGEEWGKEREKYHERVSIKSGKFKRIEDASPAGVLFRAEWKRACIRIILPLLTKNSAITCLR